jgi:hypothetical protein
MLPTCDNLDRRPCMQMALIIEPDCVRVRNILSKSWEPESIKGVASAGKQWICTPCHTALLAVHHSPHAGRWVLDAYALEHGGEQPMFHQVLSGESLPTEVAALPSQACLSIA